MRKTLTGIVMICAGMAQAEEVVIAAFGDSLTQGYGLVADQGFVPQLQGWLDGQGADVRVINAGVSGDTTAGGLARVGWTLTPDVDAMIVALGGNDLLRGLNPGEARANLTGILQAAADADVEVLLIGMQAPGNFGTDYKAQFDAIYPDLAAEFGVLLHPAFFGGILDEDGRLISFEEALRRYFQPDGIHPNAAGVMQVVQYMGADVLRLIERAAD